VVADYEGGVVDCDGVIEYDRGEVKVLREMGVA
jgi:hypothetical protein